MKLKRAPEEVVDVAAGAQAAVDEALLLEKPLVELLISTSGAIQMCKCTLASVTEYFCGVIPVVVLLARLIGWSDAHLLFACLP